MTLPVAARTIGRVTIAHWPLHGLRLRTPRLSIGVSRRLGYQPNGRSRVLIRDAPGYEQRFVLGREHWNQCRTVPVEIDGLAPCLPLLGL